MSMGNSVALSETSPDQSGTVKIVVTILAWLVFAASIVWVFFLFISIQPDTIISHSWFYRNSTTQGISVQGQLLCIVESVIRILLGLLGKYIVMACIDPNNYINKMFKKITNSSKK